MARLAAYQNGNWTGATTWKTIDTTSYLMSSAGTTATTTAFVGSANFAPGAITVEGIGLFMGTRAASPSGTMEVQLWNATGSVQVALVTVNVADLPAPPTGTTINAHVFFEFAAPVVLLAATNYQVRVRTSVASQVTFFTNGTAGNWSRYLRTSTIATAAATDDFFVCGELTAAGVNTPITVTMDNNNTNQYGFCAVGHLGTLDWATASNTELRLSNDVLGSTQGVSLYVSGGTANVGTSAARIAAGITATLRFNSTGATVTTMRGIHVTGSGTFRAYGNRRTNNWVLLTADAAAGATSLTVASGHDFGIGQEIGIAPTARTPAQFERRTITGTTATTLSFTGGLASAKSGTAPTQAEIINLTRNVSIRGNSTAQPTFINAQTGAVIECDGIMFEFAGGSRQTIFSTAGVQGATRGSCTVEHCAFKDCGAAGTYFATTTANPKDTNITNNVFYNALGIAISFAATAPTAGSNCSVNDNVLIGGASSCVVINNSDVTCTGNRVSGITAGNALTHGLVNYTALNSAVVSNNIVHSCVAGMQLSLINTKDTGNHSVGNTSWRNTQRGFLLYGSNNSRAENFTSFGNLNSNLILTSTGQNPYSDVDVVNFTANGEASFTTQYGLELAVVVAASVFSQGKFYNCSFGATTAHTLADVIVNNTAGVIINSDMIFNDCTLASTTPVLNNLYLASNNFLRFQRFNGDAADHRTYFRNGIMRSDSVITRSSPLSGRMTPSSATLKQDFSRKYVAVASSNTTTIGCYVRCSVVGDGTVYNGNRPRLILAANPSLGVDNDVVLATATAAANGAWELISGTTPIASANGVWEVYVDCDGTTGFCNVDDWSVS